jgi:hypothetical protein
VHSIDPHICHRDIKSFNFLVSSRFVIKIADLELGVLKSKNSTKSTGTPTHHSTSSPLVSAADQTATSPTDLVSTSPGVADPTVVDVAALLPNWLAPEVFHCDIFRYLTSNIFFFCFHLKVITNRRFQQASDIYSLGIVFWEIFSKQLPFENEYRAETIRQKIVSGEKLPIPEEIVNTPIGKLIQKCWVYDPHYRPTAEDICEILENMIQNVFEELILHFPVQNTPDFAALEAFYDQAYRRTINNTMSATASSMGDRVPSRRNGDGNNNGIVNTATNVFRMLNPFYWIRRYSRVRTASGSTVEDPLLTPREQRSRANSNNDGEYREEDDEEMGADSESSQSRNESADFYSSTMVNYANLNQENYQLTPKKLKFPFLLTSSITSKEDKDEAHHSDYALPNNLSRTNPLNFLSIPQEALNAIHLIKQEKYSFNLENSNEAWAIFTPNYPYIHVYGTSHFYNLFNVPSSFGKDYQLLSLISLLYPEFEAIPSCSRHSNSIVEKAVMNNDYGKMRLNYAKEFLNVFKNYYKDGKNLRRAIHDILCFHLPFISIYNQQKRQEQFASSFSLSRQSIDSVEDPLPPYSSADPLRSQHSSLSLSDRIRGYNLMCSVHVYPVYAPQKENVTPKTSQVSSAIDKLKKNKKKKDKETTGSNNINNNIDSSNIDDERQGRGQEKMSKDKYEEIDFNEIDKEEEQKQTREQSPEQGKDESKSPLSFKKATPNPKSKNYKDHHHTNHTSGKKSSVYEEVEKPMYFAILFNELKEQEVLHRLNSQTNQSNDHSETNRRNESHDRVTDEEALFLNFLNSSENDPTATSMEAGAASSKLYQQKINSNPRYESHHLSFKHDPTKNPKLWDRFSRFWTESNHQTNNPHPTNKNYSPLNNLQDERRRIHSADISI